MGKKRIKLHHNVDSNVFTRTAKKTKKINIEPNVMRGGIRL